LGMLVFVQSLEISAGLYISNRSIGDVSAFAEFPIALQHIPL
jgi:hypothetical protein